MRTSSAVSGRPPSRSEPLLDPPGFRPPCSARRNRALPRHPSDPNSRARMIELLVRARKDAGLTRAERGERIGQRQTFVSKVEPNERRLDAAEFVEVCRAIGVDPYAVMREQAAS